jgi:hypothetical protein
MLDCKPNNIPTNTNVKLWLDQGELASGRYIGEWLEMGSLNIS